MLSAFDVERISTEALLWQTGYLTIDREEQHFGEYRYRLRYPNREVYQSLNNSLLRAWTPDGQETLAHRTRLGELLLTNDFAGMRELFTAFFASLGLDLTPEESSNAGRLDLTLCFNGQVYLFELKVVELAPQGARAAADQGARLCRQAPRRRAAHPSDRRGAEPRAAARSRVRSGDHPHRCMMA